MPEESTELLIIGGGVNGAGIARDAAGRGLKVLLCEKDDLGQGTSSRNGKLIHGGLRYLEYYEFRLVREALIERDVLFEAAPHIVRPMRFVLPHSPEQRPAWLVRLGLFLYGALGGRKRLPATGALDLRRPGGEGAQTGLHARLRVLGLLGRRCQPRRSQRPGRERARCHHPDPHAMRRAAARLPSDACAPGKD